MNAVWFSLVTGTLFVLSLFAAPFPDLPEPARQVPVSTVYSPVQPLQTPTTATTAPAGTSGDCASYVAYGLQHGWPADQAEQLATIMRLESACNPAAIGDNGASRGLLQIHCPTWVAPSTYWPDGWAATHGYPITCDDLHDPKTNLQIGLMIYSGVPGSAGGWRTWSTYTP